MPEDIQISDSDGVFLVKAARTAVTEFLSNGNRLKLESEYEEKFSFHSGVFVTLNNSDGFGIALCLSLPPGFGLLGGKDQGSRRFVRRWPIMLAA